VSYITQAFIQLDSLSCNLVLKSLTVRQQASHVLTSNRMTAGWLFSYA